jgi:hypothetical protein
MPDSGSIWFLPDNERRYFVRWASKEPYKYGASAAGEAAFSLSLFQENELKRCPDFAGKLRARVVQREMVESVMQERLGLDDCSTEGIAGIVCV